MKTLIIIVILFFAYNKYKSNLNTTFDRMNQINIAYENKYAKKDKNIGNTQEQSFLSEETENTKTNTNGKSNKRNKSDTESINSIKEKFNQQVIKDIVNNIKNTIRDRINKLKSYGTKDK